MTLRIDLMVGEFARRTVIAKKECNENEARGQASKDETYTYRWAMYHSGTEDVMLSKGPIASGSVNHRYGDGLEKLAGLIMGDYAKTKGPLHPPFPRGDTEVECLRCGVTTLHRNIESHYCNPPRSTE